jgi:alpha-1,2-mannosyltransferase
LIGIFSQFTCPRPEKDHKLQLAVFQKALEKRPDLFDASRLLFVGSSRNAEDDARVDELRSLVRKMGLETRVGILVNVPFSEVRSILAKSSVGMHAMWNEHFGIGVVEYMVRFCLVFLFL